MGSRPLESEPDEGWARFGLWSGLAAGVCYGYRFLPRSLRLPGATGLVPWFLFGPLFILYVVGLYHFLRRRTPGPMLQSAALLTILSGAFVTAQFVVQSATFDIGFGFIRAATDDAARATAQQIMNSVNAAQLGLGMCWDVFVSLGTALFGACLLRHGRWMGLLGLAGAAAALAALALNFAAFPMPPAESGLIDLGPGIAVWYTVVALPMLLSLRRRTGATSAR